MSTTRPAGPDGTEQRLRAALAAAAADRPVAPVAYRSAITGWRRRERRRRLLLAVLATTVFAVADGIGLWALNRVDDQPKVIFADPGPAPSGQQPSWP